MLNIFPKVSNDRIRKGLSQNNEGCDGSCLLQKCRCGKMFMNHSITKIASTDSNGADDKIYYIGFFSGLFWECRILVGRRRRRRRRRRGVIHGLRCSMMYRFGGHGVLGLCVKRRNKNDERKEEGIMSSLW